MINSMNNIYQNTLARLDEQEVAQSTMVEHNWNAEATVYMNEHALRISSRTNENRFIEFLRNNNDIGGQFIEITFHGRSKLLPMPFKALISCLVLIRMCPNVTRVNIQRSNPYYILKALATSGEQLNTRIEFINEDWITCRKNRAFREVFYGANLNNRNTIRHMVNPPNGVVFGGIFICNMVTVTRTIPYLQFLQSFPVLNRMEECEP